MKQQVKQTTAGKQVTPKQHATKEPPAKLFEKENYRWMLVGVIVMAIGFVLMAGGKSDNPNVFDENSVYSVTRITIAPILIVAGLIIEVFAIMRKPKNADQQ